MPLPERASSVRGTLVRNVVVALGVWALAASAIAVWALLRITHVDPTSHRSGARSSAAGRPIATGSPQALIARYGCWTGQAPADMQGRLPGHAIIATGVKPRYVGARLTGRALDQVFGKADYGLTVYAFCR